MFVGPTSAGFLVERWGFRETAFLYFVVYVCMIVLDAVDILYKVKSHKRVDNEAVEQNGYPMSRS